VREKKEKMREKRREIKTPTERDLARGEERRDVRKMRVAVIPIHELPSRHAVWVF
jgi:hypothetical protein